MIAVSSNDRRDYILYDAVSGSQSHPLAGMKYLDDNGVAQWFKDLRSFSVSKGARNKQYGKFLLSPPAFTLNAVIDNNDEKYSPGAGGAFDGILTPNRKCYPYLGYKTNTSETTYSAFTLSAGLQFYHSKVSGGSLVSDGANVSPVRSTFYHLPGITESWLMFGSGLYGGGVYAPAGYYLSQVKNMMEAMHIGSAFGISITSALAGATVYYRAADHSADLTGNLVTFTLLGTCAAGASTFNLPAVALDKTYVQIAIVFHDAIYGENAISAVNLAYHDYAEMFLQGEYLMDDPSFSSAKAAYAASFSARDTMKRALETKVSTLDISGATDIATIIRNICTRAKIPYTTTTIPLTTYTVSSADGYANVKAADALEECLQYLNTFADYRLWIDASGYMTLGIKEADVTAADWVVDYRFNAKTLSKNKDSNSLLQRVIASNESLSAGAESQLATATYNTTGTKTLTWANEAMRKRWEVTVNSGDAVVVYVSNTNKQMVFTVTGTTIDVTVTVYGCELTSIPAAYAEEFNSANFEEGFGMTLEIVNRYLSQANAAALIARLVSEYGDPDYVVQVEIPFNPILEINDRLLVLEKNTNTKTIFVIESISHSFAAKGASAKTSLSLRDIGWSYLYYNWDRGDVGGYDDMLYDNGFVFDYDLWPAVSDTADYSGTKELQCA